MCVESLTCVKVKVSLSCQVEVYNKVVVFETVLSKNWFGGYLAVDSITHAEGGGSESGCETMPKAAEKTTVPPPPETTTPGDGVHIYELTVQKYRKYTYRYILKNVINKSLHHMCRKNSCF